MYLLQPFERLDHRIFLYLQDVSGPLHKGIARAVSFSADGWFILAFLIWLRVDSQSTPEITDAVITALIAERLIYFVLKNTTKRYRPGERMSGFRAMIKPSDRFSFPSGHTSAAALLAVFLVFVFPALQHVIIGWVVLVAFSRVILGVHFPTDTIAGALLGSSCAFWGMNLFL